MCVWVVPLSILFGLAACGSPSETGGDQNAAKVSAEAKPKKPAFCFFKDAETSGWSASRDAKGNIVVKGRAFRSDPRYKAELGPAEVDGTTVTISPTISQNSGYASPDNWWAVSAIIPDSRSVEAVTVRCGSKTLADLKIPPAS